MYRTVVASLLFVLATPLASAVPMQVQQQGRVLDAAGTPLDGNVSLTFELYPTATSTSSVWSETAALTVEQGYYSTELGGVQPIDSALLANNAELWLAVSVGSVELSRSQLVSVPYALSAATADAAETLNRTDCNIGDVLAWNGTEWACSAAGAGAVTTFTRWGRTACPAGTSSSLYPGWMLSGRYTDGGAAVNYLCGLENPGYSPFGSSANANGHLLWSVEFEPTGHSQMSALAQREARCVVCEAAASTTLVIPTATACPAGWTEQYQGVLAGSSFTHAQQTETICMDDNPESWGNTTNNNHGLVYAAEFERSSGMPASYLQDREPACVVCTK